MAKRSSKSSKRSVALTPAYLLTLIGAVIVAVLTRAGILNPSQPSDVPPQPTVVETAAPGNVVPGSDTPWLKVYFTDPNPPDNTANGVDQFVVPVLNAAKK